MKPIKRTIYFLLFVAALPLFHVEKSYAQKYVQEFSHIAKITFPGTPHSKIDKIDSIYTIRYDGDAYVLGLHSFRYDSTFTLDSGHLKEFYHAFIKQLTTRKDIKLISAKDIRINGLDGMAVNYTLTLDSLNYTSYHRILYVNRTLYNYGFTTYVDFEKNTIAQRESFLNSFVITEKKENLYQFYEVDRSTQIAEKLGELVGKGLFIFLLLAIVGGLGFLVIFTIRKIAYKKQKT